MPIDAARRKPRFMRPSLLAVLKTLQRIGDRLPTVKRPAPEPVDL